MKGFSIFLRKFTSKFAGKMASKTILKRLFLGSFTNIFASVLIWMIEFCLHPFMKRWRDNLLRAIGWQREKEESGKTTETQKEA